MTSTDLSPDERFIIYSTISDCVHLCNVRGEYEVHEPLYLGNGAGFGVWNAKVRSASVFRGAPSC